MERHCKKLGLPVPSISPAAMEKLHQYTWPGNVRELDNVIQRALILSEQADITQQHILLEGLDWQDASGLQQLVEQEEVSCPPD
ncbi:hypothetical protein ACT691_01365 [Vibrio metschnikovii]